MKIASVVLAVSGAAVLLPAAADPHKDESGHGRHYDRPAKQEYWDGPCKVERKWEGNGEYKEERKCRGGHHRVSGPVEPYPPQPEPGVVITVPPIVIPLPGR
jgi:hypothetical protein